MQQQTPDPTASALLEALEPARPLTTVRSNTALIQLHNAHKERRLLAVLKSGWAAGADYLLQSFTSEVSENTFVARVGSSCSSEIDAMRETVRAIGIDPKDLPLDTLEGAFARFLTYRKKKKKRSVIIFEETSDNSIWVRNRIDRLIELEKRENLGLFLILSRGTRFNELAREPQLSSVSSGAATFIALSPFTAADTRKFARWRIDAADSADLSRIFEFQAITALHELAEGVPDVIDALCCASLELADAVDTAPVTPAIVVQASEQLNFQSKMQQSAYRKPEGAGDTFNAIPILKVPEPPKLTVIYKGETIQEIFLTKSRLTIGRAPENDICLNSPFVSRKHAAIIRDGIETAVVDLDSQNGTFVNAQRVRAQTMSNRDEIKIGYHRITFLDPEAPARVSLNGIPSARSISKQRTVQAAHPALNGRAKAPAALGRSTLDAD